jgi:hypothetical protein
MGVWAPTQRSSNLFERGSVLFCFFVLVSADFFLFGEQLRWATMGDNVKKEIYTHEAPWLIYGLAWSIRPDMFRLALGSFDDTYTNKIDVIKLDESKGGFTKTQSFDHPYPATKVMWVPDRTGSRPDLMATTADYLRIWEVNDDGVKLKSLLNNVCLIFFCVSHIAFTESRACVWEFRCLSSAE